MGALKISSTRLGTRFVPKYFSGVYVEVAYIFKILHFLDLEHVCLPFFVGNRPIVELFTIFEHIFEHINCPLSGLIFIIDKCRSED